MPPRYSLSKKFQTFGRFFGFLGLILQFFTFVSGQDIDATIKIAVDKGLSADVGVKVLKSNAADRSQKIWFLDDQAGTIGLTKRLSMVEVFDRNCETVGRKKFGSADEISREETGGIRYSVDLSPIQRKSAAAHVSWLTKDLGVIMLDDLLPQNIGRTATVKFEIPAGWKITHAENELAANEFRVSNIEKSVFYLGRNLRVQSFNAKTSSVNLIVSGEWHFSDAEALAMAESIYSEYEKLYGPLLSAPSQILLSRFPIPSDPGNWEAETRGRSVTMISSDTPFKTQSKQRLHEQLRHELFHLWIPNGVNLSGSYDWFYEGFALYQSLKIGVATNTITFDNFLETLGRAYSIDSMQTIRTSLIDASKNRFGGANTTVYARGMLVAFMCDLALLERSKGKRSVENILRDVYQKHHKSAERLDGNTAILAEFAMYPELKEIADRYIRSGDAIDIAAFARFAGIDVTDQNGFKKLAVSPKPTSRQKDLLDKLGYNSWRRLRASVAQE